MALESRQALLAFKHNKLQPVPFLQWRLALGFLCLKNLRLGPIYRPEQTPRQQRVSVGCVASTLCVPRHTTTTRGLRELQVRKQALSATCRASHFSLPPSLHHDRVPLSSRPKSSGRRHKPRRPPPQLRAALQKPVVPRGTHCSRPLASRARLHPRSLVYCI